MKKGNERASKIVVLLQRKVQVQRTFKIVRTEQSREVLSLLFSTQSEIVYKENSICAANASARFCN